MRDTDIKYVCDSILICFLWCFDKEENIIRTDVQ